MLKKAGFERYYINVCAIKLGCPIPLSLEIVGNDTKKKD